MIEKLRLLNKKLIQYNKNNAEKLQRQQLIEKLLKDEMCFFKMDIDTALSILSDLNFSKDDSIKIYSDLIDFKNFNS